MTTSEITAWMIVFCILAFAGGFLYGGSYVTKAYKRGYRDGKAGREPIIEVEE